MLKVGLIVGSTRPNRFADTPVQWLVEGASGRRDLQLAVLDLRDYRDGAIPWDRPKRPLPERLRLSGAKPGGNVRPPGVVGRGIESGSAKGGRCKRHRSLIGERSIAI